MHAKFLFLLPLAVTLGLGACGDDGPRGIGGGDTAQPADTTTPGDTGADVSAPDVAPDAAEPDTAAPSVLPNACDAARACTRGVCRSGVCVEDPPASAAGALTDPATALPTDKTIELSCVDTPVVPPAETRTTVMVGALSRFGSGRKTDGLRVDVMRAADFDPAPCEALEPGEAQKTCFRELGPVIGTAIAAPRTLAEPLPSSCREHEACPFAYQCYDPHDLGGVCEEQFGVYRIEDLPLDTPLLVRAYPVGLVDQDRWHDTWMFNVILNSDAEEGGEVHYDAQIVSASQWQLTTNSVGLGDIPPENGAIGGRVRDCQQSDRESWPIRDARLGLARRAQRIVYFNNLEDDTVPLVNRETTNVHGRFAALDIEAGWNVIAGSVRIGDEVVSIGGQEVYVFPDSLTIMSWPGTNPFWRQKD